MLAALPLPASIPARSATLVIQRASVEDVAPIVGLISDDPISAGRGDVKNPEETATYRNALEEVLAAPGNDIVVVSDAAGEIVGTLQLTLIPGMARRGSTRLLIESVHVASTTRSTGVGPH